MERRKKSLFLRRIGNPDLRYKFSEWNEVVRVLNEDGSEDVGVILHELMQDSEGAWVLTWKHQDLVVPISTLLSEFVAEDSKNYNYIKDLEQFKIDSFKKAQEATAITDFDKVFAMFDSNPAKVQISKDEENEGDKEDICSLHSGESETNETGSTE